MIHKDKDNTRNKQPIVAYLTTFNHWIRKLSFIKSKEVKYRVWVNKKPAGKIFRKKSENINLGHEEKNKKLFLGSTKIPSYRLVGSLPYLVPTFGKNNGLNRKFEKCKFLILFNVSYMVSICKDFLCKDFLLFIVLKKRLNLAS